MNIEQIKDKYTCLDYLGDRVVRKTANGYLARAPWRDDKHPSLTVSLNGRGFKDQATGAHGSVIDMVMLHLGCDFASACEHLERTSPHFSFPQPDSECSGGREKGAFTRFEVMPLQSKGLFAYLHKRGVNVSIAKQFLKEAHYSTKDPDDGTYLYALAYGNDKGGYELRNSLKGLSKLAKAPKGITAHLDRENAPVVVFEGFMDMLSFATLCGGVKHNYVVLNSTAMVASGIEVLKTLQNQVYLALDNDDGGESATKEILAAIPGAIDIRSRFAPAKDINDYLTTNKPSRI